MNKYGKIQGCKAVLALLLLMIVFLCPVLTSAATDTGSTGEQLYRKMSDIANKGEEKGLFGLINENARKLDWQSAAETTFHGNLRILIPKMEKIGISQENLYLLRTLDGEVFILSIPEDSALLNKDSASVYAGLNGMSESKMNFKVRTSQGMVEGEIYPFAQFIDAPKPLMIDRIFRISMVLLLFFVMVGMGMTLAMNDFALVFKKPKGIILGQLLQFALMPAFAFALGRLLGFDQDYPFIFVGMVLITAIPGGVTSNLMTYYAKGDLALSISLTSFSTVLSVFFTPLLLAVYCSNLPEVEIPVKIVVQTILILVIVPLIIGMAFRANWPQIAKKSVPFFSALGIITLLALIVAGIISNWTALSDLNRYGMKFYSTVFVLTFLGMMLGIVFSKIILINNYQTRAISLETGLRNASLAMTIAILIQDAMGDFYSSMLVTSGLFGLVMYVAGIISIFSYKFILPLTADSEK